MSSRVMQLCLARRSEVPSASSTLNLQLFHQDILTKKIDGQIIENETSVAVASLEIKFLLANGSTKTDVYTYDKKFHLNSWSAPYCRKSCMSSNS